MPPSHQFSSSQLLQTHDPVPWQVRAHPTLAVTAASLVVGAIALGFLLNVRRLTGNLSVELSLDLTLLLALGSAIAMTYVRVAWRRNFPVESPAELDVLDQLLGWGSSLALVLLAVGCCYPGNRTADWLIWLPILVADQFWRQNFFDGGVPEPQQVDTLEEIPSSLSLASLPEYENIVQQLYRVANDQGDDEIYGTMRADFVAGQRTAIVHVGFCPPLTYQPEIEAEALPGAPASLKVVQAFAHGARLDVRLAALPTEDCQVWIDLAAHRPGVAIQAESA